MKNHLLKVIACLMFAGMFQCVSAQTAPTTAASTGAVQLNEQELKRATDLTERIAGEVTLSGNQKAKLQTAMQEAVAKYSQAVRKAKKEDESRLGSVNTDLIADITARIKVILTPEQYNTVMSKETSNQ